MTRRLCLIMMLYLSLGLCLPSHAETLPPQNPLAYDVFGDCDRVTDVSPTECLGLVALYVSTQGETWTNHTHWLSDAAVCSWHGVACEAGQVVGLDLSTNNLNGAIPSEIDFLPHLRTLKLHQNQLSGPIPETLWNLSQLKILFLSRNQLSGVLSGNIDKASQLEMLVLSSNVMGGELPITLWNLPHLQLLALSNNEFTGELPSEVAQLSALEGLYLADNRFRGKLPAELGLLLNLQDLDLRFNQFEGEVPANVAQLPNLQVGNNGTYFTAKGLNLQYNALYTSNPDLAAYLEGKNSGWLATQTSAPLNLQAEPIAGDSVTLTWIPTGYYPVGSYFEVYYALAGTNDYELAGITEANFYRLVDLDPSAIYDFQVVAFTASSQHNHNELRSQPSATVTVEMANNPIEAAALPPAGGGETGGGTGLGGNTTSQGLSQDDYIQAILPPDLFAPAFGNAVVVAYELNLRTLPSVGSERMDILSYGTYVQVLGQYQYPAIDQTLNLLCPTTHGYTGGQRWLKISVNGLIGWADARWLYYGDGLIASYESIPTIFSWKRSAVSFEAVAIARTEIGDQPVNLTVRSAPTWGQTAEQVIPATHITGRIGAQLSTDRGQIDDGAINRYEDAITHPCGGYIEAIGRTSDKLWIEIISADGVHGWVYHQYLEVLGSVISLPVTYGSPDLIDGVGLCARADTYLRLGPGEEYTEIGLIHQNQTVLVDLGDPEHQTADLEWIKVETLDGLFGWANRLLFQESNTGIETLPAPQPPYAFDLDALPVCNPYLGTQASIDPPPDFVVGSIPLPNGILRAYNIEPVTLRNGAGFEYQEIGFIRFVPVSTSFGDSELGQQVSVLNYDPTLQWIFVQATDGQRGWAQARSFRDSLTLEALVLVPPTDPQLGDFIYTEPPNDLAYNIQPVTVRAGPSLNYQELGVLQFVPTTIPSSGQSTQVGQLVRLLARSVDNEWVLIQATDGLLGWALRSAFYDNETLLPLTEISHLRVAP